MENRSISDESVLADLVSRWQDRRAEGREASPAELCRDHPQLLAELERRVAALKQIDALAATYDTANRELDATRPPPAPPYVPEIGPAFPGYELRQVLGKGGMGIVYQAFDRKRGQLVALKTLQGMDSEALYRFKREFRALANVSHPNLIPLYELISDGRSWCFTMELLEGIDLLTYIRGSHAARTTPAHWPRLRETLAQLGEGIQALHQAGKLHRDIKPSNALVTPQGRTVLLDFGLAAEIGRHSIYQSTQPRLLGTIPYMSPEQAAAKPITVATDWYSVGVILYEALTGRLPFAGDPLSILRDKVERDPPPPHEVAADVPADLDQLCVELLRRDPAARPVGPDIIRRLRGTSTVAEPAAVAARTTANVLLGREAHLRFLGDAFRDMRTGRAVLVHVAGPSGMGKSALLQSFLDRLSGTEGAVVLRGQCYEKESVPYKAFDSLVDALGHYLRQLPPLEAEVVLPRDLTSLARIFPVLGGFQPATAARAASMADPPEVRRRAFAALRELLARLGDRRPLVLAIDDLQWGDPDSLALYLELLWQPDPPHLLFLGSFRSEEEQVSPFLQGMLSARQRAGEALDERRLAVEPLSRAEGRELAMRLLGERGQGRADLADAIAGESGGNPLFLSELVQHALAGGERGELLSAAAEVSVVDVLWARVQHLAEGPRQLLEVLAVAGRPLNEREASQAAGLSADERAALADLRAHRLIRTTGASDAEVTTYHDRVRETVSARLSRERLRQCHHHLAQVLEAGGRAEPEALAFHFEGAGEASRAADYFVRAADKAVAALAFDRAVEFYQAALRLRPADAPNRRQLSIRLADALANARRGAEAGPVYLGAADGAAATEALELRRRAAAQLLWSGRIDDGIDVIRGLLQSMGMRLPATHFRALLSIIYHRTLLWLRGLKFRERSAADIPEEELVRIDTCGTIALSLCCVDPFRGLDFHTRYLLLALRAGEPYRVARALGIEVGHSSTAGGRSRRRTEAIFRTALALAERLRDPHGMGLTLLGGGVAAYFEGRWRQSRELLDRACQIFREQCTGVTCERNQGEFDALRALEQLGEMKELTRRLPVLLEDAEARGDLYAATNLRTRLSYLVCLMNDQPGQAEQEMRRAMEQWSHRDFHLQHYFELTTHTDIAHYRGEAAAAWELLLERWPLAARSLLLRVQLSRITLWQLRGRSALALAAAPGDQPRAPLLAVVRDRARAVQRERMAWSNPQAALLLAGAAAIEGRAADAVPLLHEAEDGFRLADMQLYAAVARRRRGQLVGGEVGRELVRDAEAWMVGQGIRNPSRWSAMYAPGFPD